MSVPDGYRTTFHPDEPDDRTNVRYGASLHRDGVRRDPPDVGRTPPPPLALEPDILGRFRGDLRLAGVAGEERLASLVYLALTSRLLPWGRPTERPVSVIPKGTTSTGKSHTTRTTFRFFPQSAWVDLGSMSRRYLFYTDESLSHRFLYVPEYASIKDDEELVALIRVLLSEGQIVHGTVDVDRSARVIRKDGPTGLLMTTTEAAVDPEMETRCLTIVTDDSTEQTRRVFGALAALEEESTSAVDFEAWHELQEWVASRETRVHVPFVQALADLMPDSATRLRRDFGSVLSLVRAHALLYQAQRDTDGRGRAIATLEGDYAPVRHLVGELIAEGVEASVSNTIRETVAAVTALNAEGAEDVAHRAVQERLKIGRSATYDRIRRALHGGYLLDLSGKQERGMQLVVGAPLPSGEDFLPSPAEIVRHTSATPTGRTAGSNMRDSHPSSGRPARPATPNAAGLADVGDPDQADLDRYRSLLASAGDRPRPLLGDDYFLPWLFKRFEHGLLTPGEWHAADRAHRVVASRGAR
jgi:hypothetical protein